MKTFDVRVDRDAEDDLYAIYTYLARSESIERADRIFAALRKTCKQLITLPLRGHVPPELLEIGVKEFREVHYKPYRIIYSVEGKNVFIHCVLDGRRDIQTLLQERLLR